MFVRWMVSAAVTAAALAAPLQTSYRPVEPWPAAGGPGAPGYGTAAVSAVATDRRGDVYVFQRAPRAVLIFDREGRFRRAWEATDFTSPHGCRVAPDGSLWLTDNADHRVMHFTPEGKILATFGVRGQAGEDETHFNRPADVAFGANGDVYIADGYGNSRVVRLSRDGKYRGAWGKRGTGPGEFNLPHSIAVDARGQVYVADRENRRIQVFTVDGAFVSQWRHVGKPFGLYLTRDQRLFVTDGEAHTVAAYDLEGKELTRWGAPGRAPGQFDLPHLLTVDDDGSVYVAEVNGKRVQKFTFLAN